MCINSFCIGAGVALFFGFVILLIFIGGSFKEYINIYKVKSLIDAFEIMVTNHKKQCRKFSKQLYITHPICVAQTVFNLTKSATLTAAALLHDVLEDTDCNLDFLQSKKVCKLVQELTNDPVQIKKIGKTKYLKKKLLTISRQARLIKLADRLDNVKDLHSIPDKTFVKKYVKETTEILHAFAQVEQKEPLNLSPAEISLILQIESFLLRVSLKDKKTFCSNCKKPIKTTWASYILVKLHKGIKRLCSSCRTKGEI